VPGKERRHYFRVAVGLAADCRLVNGPGPGAPVDARTVNLSAGGTWLELDQPLLEGQHVRVELYADEPPLELNARGSVIRCERDGSRHFAAIEFAGLDARTKARVTQFVFAVAKRTGQFADYVRPDRGRAPSRAA
jgi:c-di-GMP-binding flagellar brake protein YcgR